MRPDDVFYDVGAYHGWHAVTAATAAPDSDVVAFEPHPMSHQQLCEVVDAIDADIRACQIALSDKNGTETIGETSEPRARLGNNADGIKIETVNGDQYITEQELPRPTVIKIDTEGMELNVLEGLRTNLESEDCRLVYCELHPTLAPQEDVEGSVIRLLEELGFECEKFTDESKNHLKAKKPE
ncbi:FkbM family methyltransferase [Halorubrum pallidum]